MRKVYVLSLLILTMASGAFAQRDLDWEMDTIFKPTQITSNPNNSSTVEIHYVAKLTSGDDAKTGDSIISRVIITDLAGNPIVSGGWFFMLAKDMTVGDTLHVTQNLTINGALLNSANVVCLVRTDCNNSDINQEPVPETNNNLQGVLLVWYNAKGWGVSVEDKFVSDLINVYPNPATDNVTVSANLVSSNDTKVRVLDLNGRVVAEQVLDQTSFETNVNVAGLEPGLYMVEVSNGTYTTTKKLQVAR